MRQPLCICFRKVLAVVCWMDWRGQERGKERLCPAGEASWPKGVAVPVSPEARF